MNIGTLTGGIELEDSFSRPLDLASEHIKHFASEFDGMTKVVPAGSAVVVGAIGGAVAGIVALANKGSVINGVEESFNKLAEAAGTTGEVLINSLSEGVRGTVDSMELMQATTKLLQSDVHVTGDNLKTMGALAREMGKATGTDATQGLNTLSQALLTGNTRLLKRQGITIDVAQSERGFAKSIGTTRDQLNEAGKVEAHRAAILEAYDEKLKKLGQSQLTFKERVAQAQVVVGNWFDDLAKGVAKSQAVNDAFATLASSFGETFGKTSQSLLKTLLSGVDQFAEGVKKVGPIVIQTFGSIKDWVVRVWNEIVAFNDRFQITNNVIAGAKAAWNVLQTAFQLVKTAVQEVIAAWQTMPDWLQKIAASAAGAAIGVAAFSVGVAAVSTPVLALISKVDLLVNVMSNFTGGAVAFLALWPKITNAILLAHTAMGVWIIDMRLSAAGAAVESTVLASTALAKYAYTEATILSTGALTAFSARIGLTTALLYVQNATIAVSRAAQAALAIAVAFTSTAYTGLTNWIGLSTVAMRVSTVASYASAAGMFLLGTAILAIKFVLLPLILLWAGWKLGEWAASIPFVRDKVLWLAESLGFISHEAAEAKRAMRDLKEEWEEPKISNGWRSFDPVVRELEDRMVALGVKSGLTGDKLDAFVNGATGKLDELKDNGSRAVGALALQLDALQKTSGLPQAAFKNLADEAKRLAASGAVLTPELKQLIALFPDVSLGADGAAKSFIKTSTTAEDFAKKVTDLGKAWAITAAGFTDNAAFEKAFKGLSSKALANPEVQVAVAPGIDKLIESGKQVSQVMQNVRLSVQEADSALTKQGVTILENENLTLSQIEQMKKLGLSETDIAHNYEVTTKALQRRSAAMQEAADNTQRLQSYAYAVIADQQKNAKRREEQELAANKVISGSYDELGQMIREQSMTTTDFQIGQIQREQAEREAAYSTSGANADQIREYNELQTRLSKQRVSALMVDNTALKNNSNSTLTEMANRARATWYAMIAHPEEYSKRAVAAQKRIADEADAAAKHTMTAWQRTYSALGNVSTILDNIPGKFAEIGAMAARAGQAIMDNLASGNWIGAIVSGVTAAIGIFKKLFDGVSKEVQQARDDVDKFGGSLSDTLTEAQKLEAGGVKWKETVIAVRDAYLLVGKTVTQAESAVTALWDTGNPARSLAARKEIEINIALSKNVTAVRSLVQEYVGAGTKIPAALQANIDKLVIMGKLTAENAAAMLEMADSSVPAYADVQAAAERYGMVVETLGNQVQGLKITELATQAVTDFNLMEAAGADMTVVMAGMKDEILAIITDAAKFGTALPAAMKPIIERMDEAGYFTDEFGNKLIDVSKLTFAETLTEKIGRLVDAILDLVDAIGGASGALDDLGNKSVTPKINLPDIPEPSTPNQTEPEYHSSGGIVGKTLRFEPKGTDTIAAMLTPGERVLTVNQNKDYEQMVSYAGAPKVNNVVPFAPRASQPTMNVSEHDVAKATGTGGKESTIIVELDSKVLTRATVKQLPGEVKRIRLGRHS